MSATSFCPANKKKKGENNITNFCFFFFFFKFIKKLSSWFMSVISDT